MTPETIAAALRAELMAGVLRPGADLSQVVLAQRFGVSRIPVRDALRILAADGLVEIEMNRGARAITLTPAEIREVYNLRILLECDCLRRAAPAITASELAVIDRARRKSDMDAGTPDWAAGDWAFHRAIYLHAGQNRQMAMIEALRRTCQLFVSAYVTMPAKTPRWLDDHRILVQQLRDQQTEAAVLTLGQHLEAAAQHLLGRMDT